LATALLTLAIVDLFQKHHAVRCSGASKGLELLFTNAETVYGNQDVDFLASNLLVPENVNFVLR